MGVGESVLRGIGWFGRGGEGGRRGEGGGEPRMQWCYSPVLRKERGVTGRFH